MKRSKIRQSQKSPPAKPPHDKTFHFLIVEDDPSHAELIRRGLLAYKTPYRLTIETTLAGARKSILADPPDLLILDRGLPDGSGEELLPESPEELQFPVIVMTSYGNEAEGTRLVRRGAVDYLVKGKAVFDDLAHITERSLGIWKNRQSERVLLHRLTTRESVLRALLNNPADSIALLDRSGTILDLNPTLAKGMGKTPPEVLGTCIYDYLPADLASVRRRKVENVFKTGKMERFEDEHAGCWYDNIIQPIPGENDKVVQVLIIARDITERRCAEKALVESSKRFAQVAETAGEWIWEVDADGRYTYSSPVVKNLLGYTPEEIVGTYFYDYFEPGQRVALMNAALAAFKEKKAFGNFINPNLHKDGRIVILETRGIPVLADDGTLLGYRGADLDVTDRIRAEKALRESEERYRTLVDELPDFVIVHREGKLLYVNAAITRLVGRPAEQLQHTNILAYIPEESQEIVRGAIKKRAGGGPVLPYVVKVAAPGGGPLRWVEIRGAAILFEGQPATLNVLTDITEKKWAQDALFASEQKFRTLADYTFDWEYWIGADGKFVYVSPSCERISGYPPDEFYRNEKLFDDLIVPEDRERFRTHCDQLSNSPDTGILEFRIRTKKGDLMWIGHVCHPIYSPDGEYLGRRGSNRDITQRKAAEDALKESEIRFRSLIQNASDMIRILDRQGKIRYESPSTERILGYPEGALTGKEPWPYIHPDDVERVRADFQTIFDRTNDGIPTEFRVRRADGTYIWVDSIGSNLLGVQGVDGIVITTRPIGQRKEMEQALLESQAKVRESEEFLRQVINGAGEGIIGYDRDLHISLWNRFMEDLTGYRADEMMGKDVFSLFSFLDEAGIHSRVTLALGGKTSESADIPFACERTGKKGWSRGIYSPLHDAKGTIVGAMGIIRDVTGVRAAQRALRESEDKYRLFTETSPDMIYFIDPEGYIRFVNRRATEGLMKKAEDIVGRHLNDIFPPETARNYFNAIRHIVETGKPAENEIVEKLPFGTHWIEARLSPLFDTGNTVQGVFGISHDITDRKKAQIALEENEERYRSLFRLSPIGISLTDIAGNILEINESLLDMFGYTRDEIGSTNISSFYADPEIRLQLAGTVLAKGSVSDYELMCRRRDGSTFPILLNSARILRGGERLFQSTFVDITDRKMMEEEIRSLNRALEQRVIQRTDQLNATLEEKEVLLREIHHRVKNNLQIIISILRLQNRHITDPGMQAILLDSESRVRSMALVHEKLYRSIDLAHIDIGDYLRDLTRYLFNTYSVNQGRVAFKVEIADLSLDINRAIPIGLILNELIANALKHAFTPQTGGEIMITGSQTIDTIVLSVQDNGAGMPVDFDWRNSPSLGMHLVVTLIEQVRGTIEKEENGTGTRFVLRIPRHAGT
jgi:PAS domain S-box-containing protein